MSLTLKFFCLLLLLGFSGLFVLKNPDGETWLSADDFVPDIKLSECLPSRRSLKEIWPSGLWPFADESSGESAPIYRWRNPEGNWEFSDKPPAGVNATLISVSKDLNSDLYPQATAADTKKEFSRKADPKEADGPGDALGDMSTLIEDAKGVQQVLDDRKRDMDDTLGK